MLASLLTLPPAGAVLIGAGVKAIHLHRRRGSIALRWVVWLGVCAAVATALAAPASIAALRGSTRLPDLGLLVPDLLKVMAAAALVLIAAQVRFARPPTGWLLAALGVLLLTQLTLFANAGFAVRDGSFHGGAALGTSYEALLYTGTSGGLALFLAWTGPVARSLSGRPLRVGLALFRLGILVALVWSCWGFADVVHVARTGQLSLTDDLGATVLGGVALTLCAVGMTLPVWFGLPRAVRRWYRQLRDCRAVAPLWRPLRLAFPDVALVPARGLVLRQPSMARYRRVIEIRDAQFALRRYRRPSAVPDRCDADPRTEAVELAAALSAYLGGAPPSAEPGAATAGGGTDLDGEIRWLTLVAREFAQVSSGGR